MRRLLALVALTLIAFTAFAADDLSGLWKAKKRFGPDTRGTLVIERSGNSFVADLAGWRIPVGVDAGELAFDAPSGDASFRGKLEPDGTILGHWVMNPTPVNYGHSATTVVLQPDGTNRWRGVADLPQDEFTFFLLLKKADDGSYSALLRNVERDIGQQYGVNRLTLDAAGAKLRGKSGDVATGAYDAENHLLTLNFAGRGASYDFARDGDAADFYPRGAHPGRYAYRAPTALHDGWQTSPIDDANISRAAIEKLVQSIVDAPMDSPDAPQVHALLIARHGKLVLEEYFHGDAREQLHTTRSASKSVTSVTVGAAMKAGAPLALSSRVYEVMNGGTMPADVDPLKRTMTLENLLTMSGGFFCDDTNDAAPGNEDAMWDQSAEPDFYRYTMRVPMATPPGENAVYCSAMPNLALGMVGAATRESPMYTFDRLVAKPMQIEHYVWGLDPAGHPYGGGSMSLTARDFMKFGQLMLNGGSWNGQQIVSRDFATRATSSLYHLRNLTYGYFWWIEEYTYKSRKLRAFSARGAGGQTVSVIPELDLVVATMAGNFSSRKGMFAASTDMIPRFILPAVREAGDDPNAPVTEAPYTNPYGPSKDGSRVRP